MALLKKIDELNPLNRPDFGMCSWKISQTSAVAGRTRIYGRKKVQLATRKHRSGGQISRVSSDSLIKLWVSVFEGEILCSLPEWTTTPSRCNYSNIRAHLRLASDV